MRQCQDCKKNIHHGHYCPECKKKRTRKQQKEYRIRMIKLGRLTTKKIEYIENKDSAESVEFTHYQPKPRPILVTDDEQIKINKEVRRRQDKISKIPLGEIADFLHPTVSWLFK